jgi:hypothetical protein
MKARAGLLEAALSDCDQMVERARSGNIHAINGSLETRGVVRLKAGLAEQALADFDQVSASAEWQKSPSPLRYAVLRGRCLAQARLGRADHSTADCAAAAALDPNRMMQKLLELD